MRKLATKLAEGVFCLVLFPPSQMRSNNNPCPAFSICKAVCSRFPIPDCCMEETHRTRENYGLWDSLHLFFRRTATVPVNSFSRNVCLAKRKMGHEKCSLSCCFLCVSAKVLQIVTGAFIGTLNHWVSLGFIFFVCWGWGCFGVFFIKMSLPKQTKSFKVSKGRGDGGSSRHMTF